MLSYDERPRRAVSPAQSVNGRGWRDVSCSFDREVRARFAGARGAGAAPRSSLSLLALRRHVIEQAVALLAPHIDADGICGADIFHHDFCFAGTRLTLSSRIDGDGTAPVSVAPRRFFTGRRRRTVRLTVHGEEVKAAVHPALQQPVPLRAAVQGQGAGATTPPAGCLRLHVSLAPQGLRPRSLLTPRVSAAQGAGRVPGQAREVGEAAPAGRAPRVRRADGKRPKPQSQAGGHGRAHSRGHGDEDYARAITRASFGRWYGRY